MKNKLFSLSAALLLLAVIAGLYAVPAIAQVVKAALVLSVDEPARHPVEYFEGHQNLVLPTVPAGKRVVLQFISMAVSKSSPNDLNMRIEGATSFAGDPFYTYALTTSPASATTQLLAAPFVGYVDAGKHVSLFTGDAFVDQTIFGTVTG